MTGRAVPELDFVVGHRSEDTNWARAPLVTGGVWAQDIDRGTDALSQRAPCDPSEPRRAVLDGLQSQDNRPRTARSLERCAQRKPYSRTFLLPGTLS